MKHYTYEDGKVYTLKEACATFSISRRTLDRHLQTMDFTEAVKASLKRRHTDFSNLTNGRSCASIEREYGLADHSLSKLLRNHPTMSLEEAITYLKTQEKRAWTHIPKEQKQIQDESGTLTDVKVVDYAKTLKCSKTTLYQYLKNGYTLQEAAIEIKANQKNGSSGNTIFWVDEHTSLYRYCMEHGYNYASVYWRILCGLSVEEALNSYVEEGQGRPFDWKYEYQGVLLSSFLRKYGLDSDFVYYWMKRGKTLEEAMERCVFKAACIEDRPLHQQFLDFYHLMETYPSKDRFALLEESPFTTEQKSYFSTQYNRLAIIKRDFELLALYRKCNLSNDHENEITPFEYDYVSEMLLKPLELSSTYSKKKGKELTKRSVLYYNKPSKGNEK